MEGPSSLPRAWHEEHSSVSNRTAAGTAAEERGGTPPPPPPYTHTHRDRRSHTAPPVRHAPSPCADSRDGCGLRPPPLRAAHSRVALGLPFPAPSRRPAGRFQEGFHGMCWPSCRLNAFPPRRASGLWRSHTKHSAALGRARATRVRPARASPLYSLPNFASLRSRPPPPPRLHRPAFAPPLRLLRQSQAAQTASGPQLPVHRRHHTMRRLHQHRHMRDERYGTREAVELLNSNSRITARCAASTHIVTAAALPPFPQRAPPPRRRRRPR